MSLIRHLAPGAAVTSALIGAMALAGWVAGMDVLKSVVPGQVTMKANTALSFMAVGFSLWVLSRDRPGRQLAPMARAAALAVALFAAVTLTQYVHGHDLGIDQALFEEPAGAVGTSHPGRMAPNTAVAFMLIGTALILLDVRLRNWRPAPAMALLAAALGLLALLQYASGITNLYGVSTLTQMAIPTAFAFVVLGVGVVAARPEAPAMRLLCSETGGGRLVRGLLPVAVGLPLCLGAVRIAGEKAGLYPSATGSWLLATAYVALLVSAVWKVGRSLDRAQQHGAELARATIRDAEQRFWLLVDSVEDYTIFILHPDGKETSSVADAHRIKGYVPDGIIGADFSVLFQP